MSENDKFLVMADDPALTPIPEIDRIALTEMEKIFVQGLKREVIGIIAVVSILTFPFGLIIGVPGLFWHYSKKKKNIEKLEIEKAEEEKRRIENANNVVKLELIKKADSLTISLLSIYKSSENLVEDLQKYLDSASYFIEKAESEYNDNAFSPFWDAIESAATQLAIFNDATIKLSTNADEYFRKLSGRKHTFPVFPANESNLPNPIIILNELRRVVRLGQTNFQFANIWEHRKTQEVLLAGFRTLGEAVSNLASTIHYTISDLQQSVSSEIARIVNEEIKTREALDKRMLEQNRMLDNIQSHNDPSSLDRPTKY